MKRLVDHGEIELDPEKDMTDDTLGTVSNLEIGLSLSLTMCVT